jgi:hypothetical protein
MVRKGWQLRYDYFSAGRPITLTRSRSALPQARGQNVPLARGGAMRAGITTDLALPCCRKTNLLPPIRAYGKIEAGMLAKKYGVTEELLLWINQPGQLRSA